MPFDSCCTSSEADGLILLGLVLLGGFIYWKQSRWIVGEAKAVSGHTIAVGKSEQRVRLHALYSLQPGQPWTDAAGVTHDGGRIAKGILAQQVSGKNVKVRIRQDVDRYGRTPGQAFVDCEDVGYWMVANGYAFADQSDKDRHASTLKKYRRAEKKAKRRSLGFHSGQEENVHPQDWIKDKVSEGFERRPDVDPERLARNEPKRFMDVAEEIAMEIGEELFVEWAGEYMATVVIL